MQAVSTEAKEKERNNPPGLRWLLKQTWVQIGIGSALALGILKFIVAPYQIKGQALEPNLNNGDKIFVMKLFMEVERGDVVFFTYPKKTTERFILRVVGKPGDQFEIRQGTVYINGTPLPEPYVSPSKNQDKSDFAPITIPADNYFVMGDNRDQSFDSRRFGLVQKNYISGKVGWRYWAK